MTKQHTNDKKAGQSTVILIRVLFYSASFLISVAGIFLILKSRGFLKDKTMFVSDMKSQYINFYASLRYLFSDDNTWYFSWGRSLGGNYIGVLAYYLASPFSWITVLYPLEKLPAAILTMTVLKTGTCGLSFSVYASWIFRRKRREGISDVEREWHQLILIPFAVSYALMSYNITYAMCPMWLDGVILLPVVLLGLEKLLDGEKGLHYMLGLLLNFWCNYYTGYMVGLFALFYLIARIAVLVRRETVGKYLWASIRFSIVSVLSIGLSAPLLLPVVRDLTKGKLGAGG